MHRSYARISCILAMLCMLLALQACATHSPPPAEPQPARPAKPARPARPEIAPPAPPAPPIKQAPAPQPALDENLARKSQTAMRTLTVTATAYTSRPQETQGDPFLAAWGDRLKPGMKCIAVSRDLIALGLRHNTPVKIKGLPGVYLVKDKMNKRHTRKIDIYCGLDLKAAREWGKQKVVIEWRPELQPRP